MAQIALKEKIKEDLKTALKEGDALRASTIRLAMTAIANREIQLLKKDAGLTDEEVLEILRSEMKKRKDAAHEYAKGGRDDLAEKEKSEAEIILKYLPPDMSDEELELVLKEGIRKAGAAANSDFGKVMKIVMPILRNQASGDRVSEALKRLLEMPR